VIQCLSAHLIDALVILWSFFACEEHLLGILMHYHFNLKIQWYVLQNMSHSVGMAQYITSLHKHVTRMLRILDCFIPLKCLETGTHSLYIIL